MFMSNCMLTTLKPFEIQRLLVQTQKNLRTVASQGGMVMWSGFHHLDVIFFWCDLNSVTINMISVRKISLFIGAVASRTYGDCVNLRLYNVTEQIPVRWTFWGNQTIIPAAFPQKLRKSINRRSMSRPTHDRIRFFKLVHTTFEFESWSHVYELLNNILLIIQR